ncbi:hypothetical protein BC941DRAFT_465528 [Chlamydoabsidia padenii]|nr:hypothetical protein BC941DRAFT_465528 [Chlamydoabsidia padenii]
MDSDEQQWIDHHKATKHHRWLLTCLDFVFRRSKSRKSSSSSLISSIPTITHPLDQYDDDDNEDDNEDDDNKVPEYPSYQYASSLPSSLSPPPRHAMARQNRTRSLTPLDHSSTSLLSGSPPPPYQRRRSALLLRPLVLRLSLNVDQRLSTHSSSDDEGDPWKGPALPDCTQ